MVDVEPKMVKMKEFRPTMNMSTVRPWYDGVCMMLSVQAKGILGIPAKLSVSSMDEESLQKMFVAAMERVNSWIFITLLNIFYLRLISQNTSWISGGYRGTQGLYYSFNTSTLWL